MQGSGLTTLFDNSMLLQGSGYTHASWALWCLLEFVVGIGSVGRSPGAHASVCCDEVHQGFGSVAAPLADVASRSSVGCVHGHMEDDGWTKGSGHRGCCLLRLSHTDLVRGDLACGIIAASLFLL